MDGNSPFAPRTLAILIVTGGLAFCGALLLDVLSDNVENRRPVGTHVYSEAAVGHRGLVEVLRRLDIPVVVSRHRELSRLSYNGVLVLAEPDPRHLAVIRERLNERPVVVVLPKWTARADPRKPRWTLAPTPVDGARMLLVLGTLPAPASVLRVPPPVTWLPSPYPAPTFETDIQLLSSRRLTRIVGTRDGVLLGRYGPSGSGVWVLSDPDILSNHGLGKGDNALMIASFLNDLRRGGPVVFDETVHGFNWTPSLWANLVSMPLLPVTLLAVASIAVLIWSAAGRFGAPRPSGAALEPGKMTLIDSTADLLLYAGHPGRALPRYRDAVLQAVARALHAPGALRDERLTAWLDGLAEARGVRDRFADLCSRVDRHSAARTSLDPSVVKTALRLHRWKQEMIHGPANRPIGRRQSEDGGPQGRRRAGRGA